MSESEGGTTFNFLGSKPQKIQSDSLYLASDLQRFVPAAFAGVFGPSFFFLPPSLRGGWESDGFVHLQALEKSCSCPRLAINLSQRLGRGVLRLIRMK